MMKVSVIMPVYNGEKFLETTVKTILGQSLDDFELILVNDGSKDDSAKLCDEFAQKDSRVRVIHQKNQGICGARNTGLDAAQGEYIAFADQDDDCLPGWLSDNYEVAKEYDADLVKSGRIAETIDENGNLLKKDVRELKKKFYDREELKKAYFELRDKNVFSPVWDGLFRREVIQKHQIHFRTEFKQGEEDTAFCLEFLACVNRFATNTGVYFKHYERYATSTSSVFNIESLNGLVRSAVIEEKVLEKMGIDQKYDKALLSSAKHHLIPVLVQLYHRNCNWSTKQRTSYIRKLHDVSAFQYEMNRELFKKIWLQDRKKAVILREFVKGHDRTVTMIAKFYKTLLERKLRATVHKYE